MSIKKYNKCSVGIDVLGAVVFTWMANNFYYSNDSVAFAISTTGVVVFCVSIIREIKD